VYAAIRAKPSRPNGLATPEAVGHIIDEREVLSRIAHHAATRLLAQPSVAAGRKLSRWPHFGHQEITAEPKSRHLPIVARPSNALPREFASRRVTITRVTVASGAKNPPHVHAASEQVWVALRGSGVLLLGGTTTAPFAEGDVVRFVEGDVHGFENTGSGEFVYLSVTSPPINFRGAYAADWQARGNNAA
jgi:mannose-6-phosphate isomerase-like protein (cupin superfamily)